MNKEQEQCKHDWIMVDQCVDCGLTFPPDPSDISVREVIILICLAVAFLIGFFTLVIFTHDDTPVHNNPCVESGPLEQCS